MGEVGLTCVFTPCWVADRVQSSPQPLTGQEGRHGPRPGRTFLRQRLDRGEPREVCCSTSNRSVQLRIGHCLSGGGLLSGAGSDRHRQGPDSPTPPPPQRDRVLGGVVGVCWVNNSPGARRGPRTSYPLTMGLQIRAADWKTAGREPCQSRTWSIGVIPVPADCHPPWEDRGRLPIEGKHGWSNFPFAREKSWPPARVGS